MPPEASSHCTMKEQHELVFVDFGHINPVNATTSNALQSTIPPAQHTSTSSSIESSLSMQDPTYMYKSEGTVLQESNRSAQDAQDSDTRNNASETSDISSPPSHPQAQSAPAVLLNDPRIQSIRTVFLEGDWEEVKEAIHRNVEGHDTGATTGTMGETGTETATADEAHVARGPPAAVHWQYIVAVPVVLLAVVAGLVTGIFTVRPMKLVVGPVQQPMFATIAVQVQLTKPGGTVFAALFRKDQLHATIEPRCPPHFGPMWFREQVRPVAETHVPLVSPMQSAWMKGDESMIHLTLTFGSADGVQPDTSYVLALIAADMKQRCQTKTFHVATVITQPDITTQQQELQSAAKEALHGSEELADYAKMNVAVMSKSSKVCTESAHVIVKVYDELLKAEYAIMDKPSASSESLLGLNTRLHNAAAASRTLADDSKHIFVYIAYDIEDFARRVQSARIQLSNAVDTSVRHDQVAMKQVMEGVVNKLHSIKEDMDAAGSSFQRSKKLHTDVVMMTKEVEAIVKDARDMAPSFIQLKQIRNKEAVQSEEAAKKLLKSHEESWIGSGQSVKEAERLREVVLNSEQAVKTYEQVVFELEWLLQQDFRGVQEQYTNLGVQYTKSRDAVNKIVSLVMQSADFATPYFAEVCRQLLGELQDTLKAAARKMSSHIAQA